VTPQLAALLARFYPDKPSRLPMKLTLFGAVITAIGVLLFFTARSMGMMIASIVVAPIGMFPLFIGGTIWLRQSSKRDALDKEIVVSGLYDHVEGAKTEVFMNGFKSHDAYTVRVRAGKRVIELPVHEAEVAAMVATLRNHMQSPRAQA
jgi:hypothetical protein